MLLVALGSGVRRGDVRVRHMNLPGISETLTKFSLQFRMFFNRIVPYVNRRFTGTLSSIRDLWKRWCNWLTLNRVAVDASAGAVVGWVGAGGTLGGVIFSIFFRELSYQKAFIAMGLAAVASSFLSIFMNIKSLNAIYEEKMRAEHIKNNNNLVFHDDAPIHVHPRHQQSFYSKI